MILPDLESLRCFDAAARRLSFARAAREVALSAPAFTARIRKLEEFFGVPLFQRNNRRVELTIHGARLVPLARQTLDHAARCVDGLRNASGTARFDLTIGAFFEIGVYWVLPALPALARNRPDRSLHLHLGDTPDLLRGVKEGSVDAAITSARTSDPWFQRVALREVRFAFLTTPEWLRGHPFDDPEHAGEQVLLDLRADLPLFGYFMDAHGAATWAFRGVERLGTVTAVHRRVLAHGGVAVLPLIGNVARNLEAGRLVKLFPSVEPRSDQFRLVWSRNHVLEPEFRDLARELAEVLPRD